MYYISKAQYQQLVRNDTDSDILNKNYKWVACDGLDPEWNTLIRINENDHPGQALRRFANTDEEGTIRVLYLWHPVKIVSSKFVRDLLLTYTFWKHLRE